MGKYSGKKFDPLVFGALEELMSVGAPDAGGGITTRTEWEEGIAPTPVTVDDD